LIAEWAKACLGVSVPVLYGGSVNAGNCEELIRQAAYRRPVHRPLGLGRRRLSRHSQPRLLGALKQQQRKDTAMKIAIGADSAGKPLLDIIEAHLATRAALKSAISASPASMPTCPRAWPKPSSTVRTTAAS
jgi:hypothetical protein